MPEWAWLRAKALDMALIVVGGALGTAARVGASLAVGRWLGNALPYDILLANVSGSFLLGALAGLVPAETRHRHPHWLVGGIGFLGSYTTFSSLAYGSVRLLTAGQVTAGLLYPLGSVALGVMAVGLGDLTGAWMARRRTNAGGDHRHASATTDTIEAVEEWAEGLLDDDAAPASRDAR